MGAGGTQDCWVSCAGGDLPLPVTNCEKTLEIVSKHLQVEQTLGFEEVRGTWSPCSVEQTVWAEAGGE